MDEVQIAVCHLKRENNKEAWHNNQERRLRVYMHCATAILSGSMFNRTATHIHEGRVSRWLWGKPHTHTDLHKPKYRINRWCFHYVTFVFGVKQLASVLFLAAGPWWAPECLHYSQEIEHQRILQRTIKEVRGQPRVNTLRGATQWRQGDPCAFMCALLCGLRRDRTSAP